MTYCKALFLRPGTTKENCAGGGVGMVKRVGSVYIETSFATILHYTRILTYENASTLPSLRNGRLLGVCASVDNCRLFVGGIPKTKKREEILSEMKKVTEGVVDVIVYPSAADKTKNRGFAFVEYESHRAAAMARRRLLPGEHPS